MAIIKKTLHVSQMHCAACEYYLEKTLAKTEGVVAVQADTTTKTVIVDIEKDTDLPALLVAMNAQTQHDGYTVTEDAKAAPYKIRDLIIALGITVPIISFFVWLQQSGILEQFSPQVITYPAIFVIGIMASLSSCMVVTGGFILTFSSAVAKSGIQQRNRALVGLHVARLVGFFVLGGVLGFLGSSVAISTTTTGVVNLIVAAVMVLSALSMLDVTWAARGANGPQKWAQRYTDKLSHTATLWVGVLLGVLTFFLPCGFTQSMQLYAVSTASALKGALVMLFFALGTLPVLALMSVVSVRIQASRWSSVLSKCSGIIILAFAATNVIAALRLFGIF